MQKRFFGETKDCWGVIRDRPWDAAGYFDTETEALARAAQVGPGYSVRYGQHQIGTFGFMVMPRPPELNNHER